MTRFLIEVPHENKKEACNKAVEVFMTSGSHFMTHADWGCSDNEHKAWIIVDLDSKKDAMAVLPPMYRHVAKIVTLQKFSPEDAAESTKQHGD